MCVLTSGYSISCRDSVGGVETIWMIENSSITDASGNSRVTTDGSGSVTAITKNTGKKFYKFEVPRGTAMTSNALTASVENGTIFFTHEVSFPINSRNASVRNIVTTLAKTNRLTFVTKDNDGTYRMFGKDFGLYLDSTEGSSGTKLEDRQGYMLKFTGQEVADFLIVPANIAQNLEVAG